MATMKDVAELAGVSTATVSHVINGTKKLSPETTERVMQAISQINYSPNVIAKSLRSQHSSIIGVMVEDSRGLPVPDIIAGIADTIARSGFRMLLYDLHLLEKLYNQYEQIGTYRDRINSGMQFLLSSNVDGIIYVGMHDRHLKYLLDECSKPVVFAYSHGSSKNSFVTYSNQDSATALVRLLIARGHQKIAVIAGHPHSYPTMKRLNGYQTALQEANLTVPEGYIRYGDWEYESGIEQMNELLRLPERPTAVFAMNDLMAAGCMHAISDAGLRVPDDIAIAGFDNREISRYLQPPLTTVALPTHKIGVEAAMELITHIDKPNSPLRKVILPCEIIERQSI